MKKMLVGTIVALLLMGSVGLAEKPKILKWALIPSDQEAIEFERWKPIADYLEEKLDTKVKMYICSDYTAAILAMKFGHADLAYFGPFSLILAMTQTDVQAIARTVKKSTGRDKYYSLIIARTDSGIKTLNDLKGKTFAFVDPASTSGYIIPKAGLVKAGINDEDFSRIFFAGGHQSVILAVKSGQVDAGATNDNRLLDTLESKIVEKNELTVVHKSGMIPNPCIAVRGDLDKEFAKEIQKAFIEIPKELALKTGPKALRWVEAKTEDYLFIKEVAETLDIDLEKK